MTNHPPAPMQGFPPLPEARVNPEAWSKPPFHRWSFLHIRECVPTVAVHRGDAPSPLPESDRGRGLDDLDIVTPSGRRASLSDHLEATQTDGFLVVHKGERIYERYLNGMTPRTLHISQSMAKSVVGTVAGILIGEGAINETDLLTAYVPELAETGYKGATIRHLLDMRSGIVYNEDYLDPNSHVSRSEHAGGWLPPRPDVPDNLYDFILTLKEGGEHGGNFDYRSIETDCLAWVLERATSTGMAELVSSRIWGPMGAEEDACFTVDRAGGVFADGGFNATLRDYARFGMLYIDGRGIVPDTWIRDTANGDVAAFADCPYAEAYPRGAYRNKFWILDVERPLFTARGIYGQLIYIDPTADFVAVKLSTSPDPVNSAVYRDVEAVIETIRREVTGA